MRRIALCLYAFALVLPMVGCGDDAADAPANTTTTPSTTDTTTDDAAAPAEGG